MEQNKSFNNSTSEINNAADATRKKINRNLMLNPETAEVAPLINMGMKRLEKKLPGAEKYLYSKFNNSPGPVRRPTTREVQNPVFNSVFNSSGPVRQPTTREVQNPVFNSQGPVRRPTTREVQNPVFNSVFNSSGPVRQPTTREVQNPVFNPVFNSPGPVRQPTTMQGNENIKAEQTGIKGRQVQKLNTVQDNENIKAQVIIGLEKAKAEQTGIKVGIAFLSLLVIIGTTLGVLLGIPNIRKDIFVSSDAGATAANSSANIFASSNSSKS